MKARNWFEFRNATATEAEVYIYDEIGAYGVSAKDFLNELKAVTAKKLTVRINSPGGSIFDGSAIYNALRRFKGEVTTQIDGVAASMATYVALAGVTVRCAENALWMIHNPSGVCLGGAKDMRKTAETLDKLRDGLVALYVARTGETQARIEELMDAETWFSAKEAKEIGFVDEITEPVSVSASFDLSGFRNAPASLRDVDTKERDAMEKESVESLKAKVTDFENKLTVAEAEAKKQKSAAEALTAQLATATTERDDFKAKHEGEVTAHAATKSKLTELEAKDTTAGGKAAELLAKNNITVQGKGAAGALAGGNEDPVATWEAYMKADATTQATMRATLGDKLDAAAIAYDAAQAAK